MLVLSAITRTSLRSITRPSLWTLPSSQVAVQSIRHKSTEENAVPLEYRFTYPEFLPDPKVEWRNTFREKLERSDMIRRRTQVELPEFYVGTIMSVTSSNPHASTKTSFFLGICIQKRMCGLRHEFTLRNVVNNQGVEVCFQLYDPKIQKIEILKLEKRLDDELLYLRDALPEYSTFPLDMEPEILPEGAPVPVNPLKVILKPRPWVGRWERTSFQGLDREHMMTLISEKMVSRIPKFETPWEKYDLMKQYRATIPEEEQKEIFAEVYSELHQLELSRKKMKRKRAFVKPKRSL